MAKVSFIEFRHSIGKTNIVLFTMLLYVGYKLIVEPPTVEYISIGSVLVLSLISLSYFFSYSKKMLRDPQIKMSSFTSTLLQFVLIMGLGILTLYIFLYKGLYGSYQLFYTFSWASLFLEVVIIVLSIKLAECVANIQEVLKWLSYNTWE